MSTSPVHAEVKRVKIWGTTFSALSPGQTVREIDQLVFAGAPSYFVTANLQTLMLADSDASLRAALNGANFVVADGMPIVWAARLRGTRLPGRVTGADLLPELCALASRKGYRVFFLGGAPERKEIAERSLREKYPDLNIVGFVSPPYGPLTSGMEEALRDQIRAARPHLLFLQFAQPHGEIWMHGNYRSLGVPVCAQFGASLDFLIGKVNRAPRWIQRVGMEWVYRIWREPRRLIGRYFRNAIFLARRLTADVMSLALRRDPG